MRRDVNGVVTIHIGDYVEYQTGGSTPGLHRYYPYAGRRWAHRKPNGTLHYLQTDLVGSTTHSTNATGGQTGDVRYTPWGQRRSQTEAPTLYRYTGQRLEGDLGLYDYRARWYDGSQKRSAPTHSHADCRGEALRSDCARRHCALRPKGCITTRRA